MNTFTNQNNLYSNNYVPCAMNSTGIVNNECYQNISQQAIYEQINKANIELAEFEQKKAIETYWDITKYTQKKEADERFNERRLAGIERYHQNKEAECLVVFRKDGRYEYYIGTNDSRGPIYELMPNITSLTTKLYKCRDCNKEVLGIFVQKGNETIEKRALVDESIDKRVSRIFRACAVELNVRNRRRQEAVEKTVAIMIESAQTEYLPFLAGWNDDTDGNYHFIVPGTLTFKEVWESAM